MKVQAGSITALNPDHVDITGPGYHIRIVEDSPGVFLITGITDMSLSSLVIRPTSKNQITLVEDTGRVKPVARPNRHLDAAALDAWLDTHYHSLLVHWQTWEADRMDLWELIYDHHEVVWKEFEQSFKEAVNEKA